MPVGGRPFAEALRAGAEVFHALKGVLHDGGYSVGQGDEGGFAPSLPSNEAAVEVILRAIEKAGYRPGEDVAIALDPAASSMLVEGTGTGGVTGHYRLEREGRTLDSGEMIDLWAELGRHATRSSRSRTAWPRTTGPAGRELTARLGDKVQLVGDDLFVTNPAFIARGHRREGGQLGPHQAQPDRHAHRDDRRDRDGPAGRLDRDGQPPLRRDRGHDDRRLRRGDGHRPDQDRRPVPLRARRQVQPAPPHRGGAGRSRLPRPAALAGPRRSCPRDLAPRRRPAAAGDSRLGRRVGVDREALVDRGAIYAGWVGVGMAVTIAVSFLLVIPIEPVLWLLAPPGRPAHRLLRERPLEPRGRAVVADPRQRALRRRPDRRSRCALLLPRHEVRSSSRPTTATGREADGGADRLRDRAPTASTQRYLAAGQGPDLEAAGITTSTSSRAFYWRRAAGDGGHGLRAGRPRRPRRARRSTASSRPKPQPAAPAGDGSA